MAKHRERDPDSKAPRHEPRRRLSALDAVFVHGETPTMPMHTMGTMIIDPSTMPSGRFDIDHMRLSMEARIHLTPPWRQRLVEVPFMLDQPMLVDDPDFCIDEHLHRAALPSPGSLRELADFVGEIAGRPLDRSRPLWEMWMVEGLEGGRIALVSKLHHCMSDGASGASQMGSLLDLSPDVMPTPSEEEWNPAPLPTRGVLLRQALRPSLPRPLNLARLLLETSQGVWRRNRAAAELDERGEAPAATPAPRTGLGRAITARRSVAFASAPLDAIKFIKNTFGVTVNDAVLAACAIALQRYLAAQDDLPDEPLRCAVPVSVKSDEEKKEFSNKVSMMVVALPTHLEDPEAVVRAVAAETRAAKHVFDAFEGDVMEGWSSLAPPGLMALGAQLFSGLDLADWFDLPLNCLVSNMPGPPVPLYWGGARVDAVYPMGPVGEGIGLNLTVLSNCGRLDLGVLACRDTVRDVWGIADDFSQAVNELELLARKRAADLESTEEPS